MITLVAKSLCDVASGLIEKGGREAGNLGVGEQWVKECGRLAKTNNTMTVTAQLDDVVTMVSTVIVTMGNIHADRSDEN